MIRAAAAPSCARLEGVEGGERDRVAKLVFSRAAHSSRVFEQGIDEPHLHTLQAELLIFSYVL
jgi:hypothetical protein